MEAGFWSGRWLLGVGAVGAFPALLLLPEGALGDAQAPAPALHFWSISGAAFLCLMVSLAVVVAGWRRCQAEVSLLGAGLTALSALSLVHGVTAPGYLYGPNTATIAAGVLALPAAGLAALPLLVANTALGGALVGRWRTWVFGSLGATTLACFALLARPGTAVPGATWFRLLVAGVSGLLVVHFAARQLVLFEVGRRRASLVAAVAAVGLGLAGVFGMIPVAYSWGWWTARALDNLAVLAMGVALLVGYRAQSSMGEVLAPVVARDPLAALELGLTPEVHAFVAALERKDPSTRAHVVRTGELAMRVGERAGLSARDLRALGLGGLLHDVGKMVVPADILKKPDRLTEEEFAAMRTHAERGALLLERSRTLRDVAPLVRWHHERQDGTGYPDGLTGEDIPVSVAVISATDAWDAMTSTRHYRDGTSRENAMTILQDGAGSQWNPQAVRWLLAEVEADDATDRLPALGDVGRAASAAADFDADIRPCLDALPAEVAAIWADADTAADATAVLTGVDAYRDLFEEAPFAYFSVGADGRVAAANARACELLGMSRADLLDRPVLELYADTPEGRGRAQLLFERYLAGRALREEELEMRRADGSPLWVSLTATPVLDAHGRVVASRSVALDITARRAAEQLLRASEEKFRGAFDDAPIGMALSGPNGRFVRINDVFTDMTGYRGEELLGTAPFALIHPEDRPEAESVVEEAGGGEPGARTFELRLLRRDGRTVHALVSLSLVRQLDSTQSLLWHVQDISARRQVEDELRGLALHDPLTGVLNRRGFGLAGQVALDVASASPRLLFMDIDDLKLINDSLGHRVGDQALIDTALLLRETLRDDDVIARLGGDEFCALVHGDAGDGAGALTQPLTGRITEALARWNVTAGRPYRLSISFGVSEPTSEAASIEDLLADADRAMYRAKGERRAAQRRRRSIVTGVPA